MLEELNGKLLESFQLYHNLMKESFLKQNQMTSSYSNQSVSTGYIVPSQPYQPIPSLQAPIYTQPQVAGTIPTMGQPSLYPADLHMQLNNFQSMYQQNQFQTSNNMNQTQGVSQQPTVHVLTQSNSHSQLPVTNTMNSLN